MVRMTDQHRMDGLHGWTQNHGTTFDGGGFSGGGPCIDRSVVVRIGKPYGEPATVHLDLIDPAHHACTVSLTPAAAREVASWLLARADEADAEMQRWRDMIDKQRADFVAAQQRDMLGRAGLLGGDAA